MTDEVLSQAEVESLLTTMETKNQDAQPAATASLSGIPGPAREKITSYDFKRPERVGKEQMRALQSLHEGFGRNFGGGTLRAAAKHRGSQTHQRRSAHVQRIRLQPGESDLLQSAHRQAPGRQPHPGHQPLHPVSGHQPPAGWRQRNGGRRASRR